MLIRAHLVHVSTASAIFLGQKTYTLDSKSRVSVQPSWRPENGSDVVLVYGKSDGVPMIKVVTPEQLAAHRAKIAASQAMNEAEKTAKRRNLAARCWEGSINEQGKLLIPRELCDRLGLQPETEILQIGCDEYFEIWKKADFHEDSQLNLNETSKQTSYVANDDVGGL